MTQYSPYNIFGFRLGLQCVAKKLHEPCPRCLSCTFLEEFRCGFHHSNLLRDRDSNPLVQRDTIFLGKTLAAFLIDTGSFSGYVALLIVSPSW